MRFTPWRCYWLSMINQASPLTTQSHLASLAYAYKPLLASALLRAEVDDFQVQENLSFQPSGLGNHVYLYIQKRLLTTEELAKKIAALANVGSRDIGYAGLKDRNGVTSQWYSVDLSGKPAPDWQRLESDRVKLINVTRNERKLKQGSISANRFCITLRGVVGDQERLSERLTLIKFRGVPNYFAEQRFGIDEKNLAAAQQLFAGTLKVKSRHLRGLYYSAARSYLFNLVLSFRVKLNNWDQALIGDAMILEGSHSFFIVNEIDDEVVRRVKLGDIHPSGPLWGRGESAARADARELELHALKDCQLWQRGLEEHGLEQHRRALRLLPGEFTWEFENPALLRLVFTLPSGAYATGVVRELVNVDK